MVHKPNSMTRARTEASTPGATFHAEPAVWFVPLPNADPDEVRPPARPTAPGGAGWPLESSPPTNPGDAWHLPLAIRIAGPMLVVVVLAALAAFSAGSRNEHTGQMARHLSLTQGQYQAVSDAEVSVALARSVAVQGLTSGNEADLAETAKQVTGQSDALDKIIARTTALNIDNSLSEPVAGLLASDRSYMDLIQRLVTQAQDDPKTAQGPRNSHLEFFQQRRSAHDQLESDLAGAMPSVTTMLEANRARGGIDFPVIPILLLLAGVALTWRAWRPIIGQLRAVVQTLDWIAQGQFQVRTNLVGNDDFGRLGEAVDRLAEQLGERFSRLSEDARRGTQNRVIAEALEIADSEAAMFAVVEQALGLVAPALPGELLLANPISGELSEVAAGPTAGSPGCPVTDQAGCFALRRGHTVVFDSSESMNSCPMLRGRPSGPVSAVCVPMTFNSMGLGVVHVAAPNRLPPDSRTRDQLIDLANQAATHIGTLRTLEVTRQQASTDGLTGLVNRRVVEMQVGQLLSQGVPFVMVLADLDRFKSINDRFGHEVGDRALQSFAAMLVANVRDADVVARLGGEEFLIICPELSVSASMEALERLQLALAKIVGTDDIPLFTASFGVTHSSVGDAFPDIVRIADAGLLMAKQRGRNQAVYATPALAEEVFGGERSTRA